MTKGVESISDRFLVDIDRIYERQARVQNQISSGLRVQRASDAPDQISNIFGLKSLVLRNEQAQINLGRVKAEVDAAEGAVRQAVQVVERAHSLAIQTVGNSSESNRKTLASEAQQIHDQLVSLMRTTSEGRFVFGGDLDQTLLYEQDWSQPEGVKLLPSARATNTRVVEDEMGAQFSVTKTAHELLDLRNADGSPATANVFAAVHELGVALENDSQAGVEAAMPKLQASLDHLNRQLTFYGHAQNRVKIAQDAASARRTGLDAKLSGLQDTDIASALVELNLLSVQQKVSLGAHAQLPTSTLFDFLG